MECCQEIVPSPDLFIYLFNQLYDNTDLSPEEVSQQLESLLSQKESFPILLSLLDSDDQRILNCSSIFISKNAGYLKNNDFDENFYAHAMDTIFQVFTQSTSTFSEFYTETIFKLSKLFDSQQIINDFFHKLLENNDIFHALEISILLIGYNQFDIDLQLQLIQQAFSFLDLNQYNNDIMLKYALQSIKMIVINQDIVVQEEQYSILIQLLTNLVLHVIQTKNEKAFNNLSIFLSNLPPQINLFSFQDIFQPLVQSLSQESTQCFHFITLFFMNSILIHNIQFDLDNDTIFQILDDIITSSFSLFLPDAPYEEQYLDGSENLIITLFRKISDPALLKQYVLERIGELSDGDGEVYFAIITLLMNSAIKFNNDIFDDNYPEIFEIVFHMLDNGSNLLRSFVINFFYDFYSSPILERTNASSIPSIAIIQKLFEFANDFPNGLSIIPQIIISMPQIDDNFQEIYENAQNLLLTPNFEYVSSCFSIIESLISKSKTTFYIFKNEIWQWIFDFYGLVAGEEYNSVFKRLSACCFPSLILKDKETVTQKTQMILYILQDILQSEDLSEFSIGLNMFINLSKSCPSSIHGMFLTVYNRIALFFNEISKYEFSEVFIRTILVPCVKCFIICANIMEVDEHNIEYFRQLMLFITIIIEISPSNLLNDAIELFNVLLLKLSCFEEFTESLANINAIIIQKIISFIDQPSYYISLSSLIRKYQIRVLCGQEDLFIDNILNIFKSSIDSSVDNLDILLNILEDIFENIDKSKVDSIIENNLPYFLQLLDSYRNYGSFIIITEFLKMMSSIPDDIISPICYISLETLSSSFDLCRPASDLLLQIFISAPLSIQEYLSSFIEIFQNIYENISQLSGENFVINLCTIQHMHPDLELPTELYPYIFHFLPLELFTIENSRIISFLIYINEKVPQEMNDMYLQVIAKILSQPISDFSNQGYDGLFIIQLATILITRLQLNEEGMNKLPVLLNSDDIRIRLLLDNLDKIMNIVSEH